MKPRKLMTSRPKSRRRMRSLNRSKQDLTSSHLKRTERTARRMTAVVMRVKRIKKIVEIIQNLILEK